MESKTEGRELEKPKTKKITAQYLREQFLIKAAPLLDQYINAALGTEQVKSVNSAARDEVWSILKALLLKSTDKIKLSTPGIQGIINAIESGECTPEEAQKLIDIYKTARDATQANSISTGPVCLVNISTSGGQKEIGVQGVLAKSSEKLEFSGKE
jgi:Asp-tRNA(Asn)/Glu-tRNA(Gln) amidotransferase B subunit